MSVALLRRLGRVDGHATAQAIEVASFAAAAKASRNSPIGLLREAKAGKLGLGRTRGWSASLALGAHPRLREGETGGAADLLATRLGIRPAGGNTVVERHRGAAGGDKATVHAVRPAGNAARGQ